MPLYLRVAFIMAAAPMLIAGLLAGLSLTFTTGPAGYVIGPLWFSAVIGIGIIVFYLLFDD